MICQSPIEMIITSWLFHLAIKNKLLSNEIAMICQSPTEMIMPSWLFHAAIKKQNIIA
jgi:ABC-type dipeptide/oligopeptide/nickel transport system ATPase component